MDDFVIPVGKKYRGIKLKDIPLKELDWYLGYMESWPIKSPRVLNTITAIKVYLNQPAIQEELERSLES